MILVHIETHDSRSSDLHFAKDIFNDILLVIIDYVGPPSIIQRTFPPVSHSNLVSTGHVQSCTVLECLYGPMLAKVSLKPRESSGHTRTRWSEPASAARCLWVISSKDSYAFPLDKEICSALQSISIHGFYGSGTIGRPA